MTGTASNKSLAPLRQQEILRHVDSSGAVLVSDIAAQFGVSQETVRRDLKLLAGRGALRLVHGGATRLAAVEPGIGQRAARNAAEKAAIGKKAATMVANGMVVLLDAGTTTGAIAAALGGKRDLTVITTSLPIAQTLCHEPGIRVQITGGAINPGDEAAEGPEVLRVIERFRIDLAFVSVGGVTPDGDLTDFTEQGAEQRSRMIAVAARGYFVFDSSKYGLLTPCKIPAFERAAGVITDKAPDRRIANGWHDAGLKLMDL